MGEPFRSEFPALLPAGLHRTTMAEVRRLCVDHFPTSATRPAIMRGLETVVAELLRVGIVGDLWIDGSYLTECVDPNDVDLTLRMDAAFVEMATDAQWSIINWLVDSGSLRTEHRCDAYAWVDYPRGHPLRPEGEAAREYWTKQWGVSQSGGRKGIALVKLPEDAT